MSKKLEFVRIEPNGRGLFGNQKAYYEVYENGRLIKPIFVETRTEAENTYQKELNTKNA